MNNRLTKTIKQECFNIACLTGNEEVVVRMLDARRKNEIVELDVNYPDRVCCFYMFDLSGSFLLLDSVKKFKKVEVMI